MQQLELTNRNNCRTDIIFSNWEPITAFPNIAVSIRIREYIGIPTNILMEELFAFSSIVPDEYSQEKYREYVKVKSYAVSESR